MSDRDYYEILGLTPTADGSMVDQAYWHLARKYQGLAGTNPRAQYMLDELNEAYGVLGNPRLREQYDAFRDDVLIRKGMVEPVKAKPHAEARRREEHQKAQEPRSWRLPHLETQHARTYALAAIVAALAFSGAWQGVNVIFVVAALGLGLALALTPTLSSRLSQMQISMPTMPSMPQVTMPQIQAPHLSMPTLPEIQRPQIPTVTPPARDEQIDPDELRASTAATIARWRASVGLKAQPHDLPPEAEPSTTLVDILGSEREIDEDSEPLMTALEILRGTRRKSETPS
jgi:hypothetical protein